eukprot:5816423-Pleurochrysis_carterae.AAC.1
MIQICSQKQKSEKPSLSSIVAAPTPSSTSAAWRQQVAGKWDVPRSGKELRRSSFAPRSPGRQFGGDRLSRAIPDDGYSPYTFL